ncbi:MAG: tyrosine-type recombinase/integrase [Halobacteriaceae archaeon]
MSWHSKLMWHTTARSRAIANIKIDNIDRKEGEILIENLKSGKDEAPYRTVVYPPDRIDPLLTEWLDRGKREGLGPYSDDSSYLFLTHQSEQLRAERLSRKVKWAAQDAGINEKIGTDARGKTRWKVTAHTIRHSAITWLANETDVPLHLVKRQAGHSKYETTLSYVHEDDEAFKRELNKAWE